MAQITFRPYRQGDEVAINESFNRVFGLQRSLEEWQWKFPATVEGRWSYLATDADGDVVAQYAAVPVRMQAGGHVVVAGQVVDAFCARRRTLVRQGTFNRTVESFFDELCGPEKLSLLFGFPGERHLRLGLLSLGYGTPRPVELWVRGTASRRRRWWWQPFQVRQGFDPEGVDALWGRASHRYPFAAIRDASWIGRRYRGRPGVDYLHLAACRGRTTAAYGIFLLGDPLKWIDLIWDGRDPRALEALDRHAADLGRELGCESLEMWLGGDERAVGVVSSCGWERRQEPQRLCLTVRSFDPRVDAGEVTGRLYITMGDGDLV